MINLKLKKLQEKNITWKDQVKLYLKRKLINSFWTKNPGYVSKIIQNVNVSKWASTKLDVQLRPLTYDIQDKSDISILVYPNPSDGHFRLTLPGNSVSSDCFIQIINTMGCVIYSSPRIGISENSTIDLPDENLPDGVYYLKFNNGCKIILHKLLIKR